MVRIERELFNSSCAAISDTEDHVGLHVINLKGDYSAFDKGEDFIRNCSL